MSDEGRMVPCLQWDAAKDVYSATLSAREDLRTVRAWCHALEDDGRWTHLVDPLGALLTAMFFLARGLDVRSALWEAETLLVNEGRLRGPVVG